MRLLTVILTVLFLFTSCGISFPETAEDVETFDSLLTFMTGNPENTVTGVILSVDSAISNSEPVALSERDTSRLLSLLTEHKLTVERYEPEHIYGGSWYTVTFLLSEGGNVNLYPAHDELMIFRRELNEDQRWYDAPYRLNIDTSQEFYAAVGEIWSCISDEEPATH